MHERRGELHVLGVVRVETFGVGLAQISGKDAGRRAGILAHVDELGRNLGRLLVVVDARQEALLGEQILDRRVSARAVDERVERVRGEVAAVVVQPQVELELGDQGLILLVAHLVEGQQARFDPVLPGQMLERQAGGDVVGIRIAAEQDQQPFPPVALESRGELDPLAGRGVGLVGATDRPQARLGHGLSRTIGHSSSSHPATRPDRHSGLSPRRKAGGLSP